MSVKDDIHSQIVAGLANATFPIESPEQLLAALPEGANTTCRSGDVAMTAGEAGTLLKPSDFPFRSAKEVADTIIEKAGL